MKERLTHGKLRIAAKESSGRKRMNRKIIIGLVFLVTAVTVVLLWPSDQKRIKKLFKEGAEAVQSKNLDGVMSKVSFNYRDDYGMTYVFLRETLKREFERLSDINVEYRDLRIRVFREKGPGKNADLVSSIWATAEMDVRVLATIGTQTGYIIGDPDSPLHLKFTLEKERLHWLIVKTEGLHFGQLSRNCGTAQFMARSVVR